MEKEKMINEAVNRMKNLGLFTQIINEFKKSQVVEYSEPTPLGGILYWVHNNPEWMDKVKAFEQKYGGLVYHAVHSYTEFGELLHLLYVSQYEEEWEMERLDIEDRAPIVYGVNLSDPTLSEFGSIRVQERAGGLIQVSA